ncbi:hypothetical protein [Borreliella afzelii]|uniref:hypothetical protein n=1 Tax=Borreliella afzelii TaxID=29518 RepID=UPI00016B3A0C|nr:hypothetical protein [Borreliella afzelii]ACJ73697.1 conserved hypothetical protein [Borreliella afzelii ACA-1]AIK19129.1 hypothetical protein P612_04370 [Borreliella afzelii Tom3107]AJY72887.1 hypothetical protein BAFK78_B002 [Borreliella afzelii K78]APJ09259.1 hypothetical protein BLA32_05120 [Borreliella afzelii]
MKIGLRYFFKKILKSNDNRTIYISYLYDKLASVKPAGDWLKIYFKDSKRGKKYFILFNRNGSNGSFISCRFLKTGSNCGLDIKFSDGNLNIFCRDRKSLEFLKFKVEHFFRATVAYSKNNNTYVSNIKLRTKKVKTLVKLEANSNNKF